MPGYHSIENQAVAIKRLFSTSKVNNTLFNCFVLEQSIFKTKQLVRVLLNLLVLNKFLNGLGFRLQLQKSFQPIVFDLN